MEVLRIYIDLEETIEVKGEKEIVRMIRFGGKCSSELFSGEILPGGVDTQRIQPDGKTYLSARYCMEGKDCEGQQCRIFIENTALFDESENQETAPRICTDSSALKWLEQADLYGRLEDENGQLVISICKKNKTL